MLFNELHQGGIRALLEWDDTIFDTMVLPDDWNDEDGVMKQMIIDDIILRHGDTPLFIPDPTVMKYYIGTWSVRMWPIFMRFWNACFAEYDPIENYNRNEDTTIGKSYSIGNTRTLNTTEGTGNTRTLNTSRGTTGTYTTEESVSAENVVTYSPDNKTVETPNTAVADTGTITDQGAITNTGTIADQGANVGADTISGNIHGNIGVTTSQQMLEQEIALIPKLDVIRFVSDSWANEFCLAVY